MPSVHVNVMTLFISKSRRTMRHLANTQDEVQNVVPVLEVCQRPLCFFCRCKVTNHARTLYSLLCIITISKCVYFDFFSQYSNMRQVLHQRHHRFPRRCSPSHPVHSFLQTRPALAFVSIVTIIVIFITINVFFCVTHIIHIFKFLMQRYERPSNPMFVDSSKLQTFLQSISLLSLLSA